VLGADLLGGEEAEKRRAVRSTFDGGAAIGFFALDDADYGSDGHSSLAGSFTFGKTTRPTFTQGLVWIDPENYQILRIISDLVSPLPQVRIYKETTDITFSEVQFKQVTQKFWLPEAVTVTLDWNGRNYRNHHAYSEFLVSNVEATQKIGKPKEMDESVDGKEDKARIQ